MRTELPKYSLREDPPAHARDQSLLPPAPSPASDLQPCGLLRAHDIPRLLDRIRCSTSMPPSQRTEDYSFEPASLWRRGKKEFQRHRESSGLRPLRCSDDGQKMEIQGRAEFSPTPEVTPGSEPHRLIQSPGDLRENHRRPRLRGH